MPQLDKIAALGEEVGVTVTGMIDSGIWVDIEPPAPAPGGSAVVSLQTQTQGVYNLVNPSAIVPPQCAEDNQGAEWKCLFGQYRMPYLTTPYFANQAQFDTFQLEYDVGGNPPTTAAQVAFADAFQQASLAVVNSLPTPQQQGSGMFSTSCLLHCVTDGPDFWTVTVNGQSLENALSAWYFKGSAPVRIVDNSCQGWACHTACIADERPPATANGGGGTNAPVGSGNSGSSGGGTASDEGSGGLPWTAVLGQERSAEKANLTALAASGTPLTAAQQQELASLDADPYLSGGGGGGSGGGSGSGGGGGAQYETAAQRSQAQGAMQVTASEPRLTTSQSAALNQFLLQQNVAQASEAVAAHRSAVTSFNAGSSTYPGAAGRRLLRAA